MKYVSKLGAKSPVPLTIFWNPPVTLHQRHSYRFKVLMNHTIRGAAALLDVARESPDEPDVVGGVYENFDVQQVPQRLVSKNQNAL